MALVAVRWVLPAAIALAGVILIVASNSESIDALGVAFIGIAVLVVIANLLMRLGLSSERDREREQEARGGDSGRPDGGR
jgi:hypothetical protein